MKKLKPRRYIIIGDTTYYHGDYITASIKHDADDDDFIEVRDARICINKKSHNQNGERHFVAWICQNERPGCTDAEETFGFNYSWVFNVNNEGDIISDDTESVLLDSRADPEPLEEIEVQADIVEQDQDDEIDDDPMPPDWVPTEKDLLFLKN